MEDGPTLFTKVLLFKEVDVSALIGSAVTLQIDESYKIGKSIAVLYEENVIGHLEREATRVIWRHLRSHSHFAALVYTRIGSWMNQRRFTIMSYSFEIGIKIKFTETNREDARLLLAHIARKKLNSFPGVEVDNCPHDLARLLHPIKDENGIFSIQFAPDTN